MQSRITAWPQTSSRPISARTAKAGGFCDEALVALARDDLVHTDGDGRPVVAYPFSARDRGHRILIDGLHEVEAMCAIDALGIAPMLERPIEIRSRDPISGGEIHVQLHPEGAAHWQPEG